MFKSNSTSAYVITQVEMQRVQIIVFVGILSACLILVTTVYRHRVAQIEEKTVIFSSEDRMQYEQSVKTQTKMKANDVLPELAKIPGDEELVRLNETTLLNIYWKYINILQILCKEVIRVGSFYDGGKEICIDPDYIPRAPCLVYSFGINYAFDFDISIVEKFGCDVHCFDPSMTNETQQVSEHIWFYKWGIGGKNEINANHWTIKTLDTIRQELGHTNRTLDLLKIDIEGDEWNSIPQMISSGALDDVRQISMETHFSTVHPDKRDFWGDVPPHKQLSALRQLYDFGYRIFMRERNLSSLSIREGINGSITNVNEISMIKPKR